MATRTKPYYTPAEYLAFEPESEERHEFSDGEVFAMSSANRRLADIDLYVPGAHLPLLAENLADYLTFGPKTFQNEHWRHTWMALAYHGQKIEIGDGDDVQIFDRAAGRWIDALVDFDAFETKVIFERPAPVLPRDRLIDYKRRLGRDVDLLDLAEIDPEFVPTNQSIDG